MSYQLIHTSAPRLMDSTSAGYGTVAMSEHLPHALRSKLGALSVFREPRGGAATTGPQFSYHILDHAGKSWHVLSCVQPAGADYSGRACHIAHHLVLTPEEVEAALADEQRPTPAGVALALLNNGFWKGEWKSEPAYLTGEPELRPGDMPAADAQPTWKLLTGHKANARAFFTHPYDRECLITLPPGTPVQQALGLLHESDWLTQTRGWGASYTTAADDADRGGAEGHRPQSVRFQFCPSGQRLRCRFHPVLRSSQCRRFLCAGRGIGGVFVGKQLGFR